MTAEPLSNLDRSTLRERALEALRSAITSGQYRPGDHLSEVALAGHLGVSRGTVREALRHLQQEGLVTAGNRDMLRVSTVSPKEVRELFRVRAALEGLAVAEIIASPERDDRRRDAAHGAVRAPRQRRRLRDEAGGRPRLPPAAVPAVGQRDARGGLALPRGPDPGHDHELRDGRDAPSMMARERHAPIVDAIERGDVAAAKSVVEQHMAAAAQQYAPEDS